MRWFPSKLLTKTNHAHSNHTWRNQLEPQDDTGFPETNKSFTCSMPSYNPYLILTKKLSQTTTSSDFMIISNSEDKHQNQTKSSDFFASEVNYHTNHPTNKHNSLIFSNKRDGKTKETTHITSSRFLIEKSNNLALTSPFWGPKCSTLAFHFYQRG